METISFSKVKIHKELYLQHLFFVFMASSVTFRRTTKFDNKSLFMADFMVGTINGYIAHIQTNGDDRQECRVVREEAKDSVICCAAHPNAHRVAIGSCCGLLRVFDYKTKSVLVKRNFIKPGSGDQCSGDITAIAIDPTGVYLCV